MATATSTINYIAASNTSQMSQSSKGVSDMLNALVTAGVLTKTADTGQINWSTFTFAQSMNYYEIFTLNDSLASTAPLYFKMIYQTSTSAAQSPMLAFQLGTGSDGAGNLTNATAIVQIRASIASGFDSTQRTVWASAGDGYLNIFGFYNGTNATVGQFGVSLERLRDYNSGALTGDGVAVICSCLGATGSSTGTKVGGATVASAEVQSAYCWSGCFAAPFSTFTNLFATTNHAFPPVMWQGSSIASNPMYDGTNFILIGIQPHTAKLYAPMSAFITIDFGQFTELSTMTIPVYSASHTYFANGAGHALLLPTWPSTAVTGTFPTSMTLFMRQVLLRYE